MNVLVTGGAGYIGSHTCKALAKIGFLPVVYDNLSRGNRWAVKWGPFEEGDISDAERVIEVLEKYNPIGIMHFAAYAYVGESADHPLLYYDNNVLGTLRLLQAIVSFKRIPVIFSSSCATYGIPNSVPITEDHPQRPVSPYGRSKLFVEQILADVGGVYRLPWMALRYFNAAGADPEGEIGEAHTPETHLVPLVIKAAQTRTAVRVYGTDYATDDGTCVRDYIHVSDVADAHTRALNYLLQEGESCAVNLANTRGYSVLEVIAAVERVCGLRIAREEASRRGGDPPKLIGDASRARNLLGWEPQRSELEVQIQDAWSWASKTAKSG